MEATTGLLGWRDASTACFTDDTLTRTAVTGNEPVQDTPVGGVCLLLFIVERIFLGLPPDPILQHPEAAPFE